MRQFMVILLFFHSQMIQFPCSRPDQISRQRLVKLVHPNRHLETIKRIRHHKLRVNLIAPPTDSLGIRLLGAREEQELDTGWSLEAREAEMRRFEGLDAGCGRGARSWCRGTWGDR